LYPNYKSKGHLSDPVNNLNIASGLLKTSFGPWNPIIDLYKHSKAASVLMAALAPLLSLN